MQKICKQFGKRIISLLLVAVVIFAQVPITNSVLANENEDLIADYAWAGDGLNQLDFHNEVVTIPLIDFAELFQWTKPTDMIIRIWKGDNIVFTVTDSISDLTKLTSLDQLKEIGITLEADTDYRIEKGTISIVSLWPFSYKVNWSNIAQFSTKVYDILTVESNKSDLVTIDGVTVTDSVGVKIYRGQHPTVAVSLGELQNYTVVTQLNGVEIMNDVGTYTFEEELTADTKISVIYVEDTESTIDIGVVSGNETIIAPLTAPAESKVQFAIEPKDLYYINSVTVTAGDEEIVLEHSAFINGVFTGAFTTNATKTHYKINCSAKPMMALNGSAIAYNETTTLESVKAQLFALIDQENSAPIFGSAEDLVVEYNASNIRSEFEEWKSLDYAPEGLNQLTHHAFGKLGDYEVIKFKFVGDTERYQAGEVAVEIALHDKRSEKAGIDVKDDVSFVYGTFTTDDLRAALMDGRLGVYDTETGEVIDGAQFNIIGDATQLSAGIHELTLRFDGNTEYKGCSKTINITIEHAESTLTVNSTEVVYGSDVSLQDLISTDPANISNVAFVVGFDAVEQNAVVQVDVTNMIHINETIKPLLDPILEKYNGKTLTLAELEKALADIAKIDTRIDLTALQTISEIMAQISALDNINDVMVTLSTDGKMHATNTGVYIIGAVTADINYTVSYDLGYLVIKPDAAQITIAFNNDFGTILSFKEVNNDSYDFGAHIVEEGAYEAAENMTTVFFGVTKDGEVYVANVAPLEIGAYSQLAYVADFGNQMYYALPIAREYVIAPELVDIAFIDFNGDIVDAYEYTYDGMQKLAIVVAADKDGNLLDLTKVTYHYYGVTSSAVPYNSENAPIDAGLYTVIAIYRDEEQQMVGWNAAAMVIHQAASDFEIIDAEYEHDGTAKFIDVKNANGLAHVYLIVNSKEANIIVPADWTDGTGILTGKDAIAKILDVISINIENDTEGISKELAELLADIEEYAVTLNGETPSDVGEYKVYAVAFGANYKTTLSKATLKIVERAIEEPKDPVRPFEPPTPTDPPATEPPVIEPYNPTGPNGTTSPSDPTDKTEPVAPTGPSDPADQDDANPSDPTDDADQNGPEDDKQEEDKDSNDVNTPSSGVETKNKSAIWVWVLVISVLVIGVVLVIQLKKKK